MKRYFVMPWLLGLLIVFTYAVYKLFTTPDLLAWSSVILACLPMLVFMGSIGLLKKARTREHLYPELGLAVAATLMAIASGQPCAIALAFLFGVAGTCLYDFWYSDLQRPQTGLQTGEALPDFALRSDAGEIVSSLALTTDKRIWMFIRGNWCPLCMAQVQEVADAYNKLADLGVKVSIITPQPEQQTRKLAETMKVGMEFFVDEDNRAAKALDIFHEGGVPAGLPGYGQDTVFPTILISNEQGIIIYSDLTDNYRVRPEPGALLEAVTQASI